MKVFRNWSLMVIIGLWKNIDKIYYIYFLKAPVCLFVVVECLEIDDVGDKISSVSVSFEFKLSWVTLSEFSVLADVTSCDEDEAEDSSDESSVVVL